ncbi:MAG: M13 family metallopeptidase N-terminal domain-containing protein, partial [Betaproteobacteria bacterium]
MSKRLVLQTIFGLSVACNVFAQTADQPATSFPYTPGLDVNGMDKTANPCEDFYQYTCGGWMKNNPIPADQPRWSVYGKLTQDNQRYLWGILDTLAKNTTGRNPRQQKIGDYFAACMDESAVEKLGAKPLAPHLNRISALKSKGELPALLARLQLDMADSGFFFGFGSNQDFADSSKVIAFATSGGLSLPDRDYYLKPEDKSKQIRDQFTAHVARVFELLGDSAEVAKRNADKVMEMETAMAAASLSRVDRRDPHKLFHNMDAKGLKALTPGFDWSAYLKVAGLSKLNAFNVTEPDFFKALEKQW